MPGLGLREIRHDAIHARGVFAFDGAFAAPPLAIAAHRVRELRQHPREHRRGSAAPRDRERPVVCWRGRLLLEAQQAGDQGVEGP